jgi:hypothetical protein
MGKVLKGIGKLAGAIAPVVSMFNPLIGAGLKFAGGLAEGKNPFKSLLSAGMDLIPGSGLLKGALGQFGGKLLEGAAGNGLVDGVMSAFSSPGKITDVVKDVVKNKAEEALSKVSNNNLTELAARQMAQGLLN